MNTNDRMTNNPIKSNDKSWMSAYKPLLWLLVIPVLNLLYGLQNHPGKHVQSLVTEIDQSTPFIASFVVPYVLWYPFLFGVLVLLLRRNKEQYYRTLLSLCLGLLLSNLIYLLFQTTVPRPEVPSTGFFNHLVSFVYASDQPYNCFPSIHVLTSMLMILGSQALGWTLRIPIVLFALSIIASTLFIKQHVIADVLAGMLAARLVFWLAGELLPRMRKRGVSANARRVRGDHYAN